MELLKFYAEWCGPCDVQTKELEDFDAVPVVPVDIEEYQELANKYNVRTVPTLILRDNEQVIQSFIGVTGAEEIEKEIEENERIY